MSILYIDIGNSRIKWALARGARLGRQRALPLAQFARFVRALRSTRNVQSVHAVCVAGLSVERRLRAALRLAGLPAPRFARSSRRAAGVINAYRDPWRLGADRWVGMIGAWHLAGARRAVCAISAGTALTLDVVDAAGRHRGGLIAPGPEMMVGALLGRTRGIAARAAGALRSKATPLAPPLAGDTRSAITMGSLLAAAGLVERCLDELRSRSRISPAIYLTGGAAPELARLLSRRYQLCPDLVLRGLAVMA